MAFSDLDTRTKLTERFEEVLAVAARLIAKDGFERASIRAIAQEAALSQAGLYHYVESKEELLFLIQKHTFTALRNSLAARLDPDAGPLERLRVMIRNHLEFFLAHMDELRVCTFDYNKLSGEHFNQILPIRRDYFRIAHSIVKDVLNENGTRPINSKRATLYLFGTLNWIHMWFRTERRTNIELIAEEITGMVLWGIGDRNGVATSGGEKGRA
ncbi:MAG: TetR/AcrR family transcriptional regulator [Acidobacteriota bacterium]